MAEVLGIVTGALQLLDTALKAAELVKNVYRVTQEKQEIHDELEGLKPLLAELQLRISANSSPRVLRNMAAPLAKFKKTLEELCSRLQPTKNTFERLKWGFSEKKKMKEDLLTLRQFHDVVNSWMILDFWDQIDAAQRLAIIEWLSPLNFFIRQQDISRTRQPETGDWLLNDPKFKEWELGKGGVLWCSGIREYSAIQTELPLTYSLQLVQGKLFLHHLTSAQAKTPEIGIACIYFNHKETQVQTLENLLAALWRQLVFKQPLGPASDLYAQLVEKKTKPTSTEMQKVLLHALQRFKQIYFIIDAVDEHSEQEWHTLAGILTKLSKNIRLLITARTHVAPNVVFSQIAVLEIRASKKDLELYIKAQMEALPHLSQHIADNREIGAKIFSVMFNSVDGMFLLAKLHLEALDAAPNTRALHDALETLPTDLNHTYQNILSRIGCLSGASKKIAHSALVWVANAKRPLTAVELCEAIAIEPGTSKLNKDNKTGIQVIIRLCTGLIILDEQSSLVRLVHFTAQDYLDKVQHQEFPFAHVQITRSLFTYLNFKEVARNGLKFHTLDPFVAENEEQQLKEFQCQYPLMNYCQYILIHAQLCEEQLQDEVIGFLDLAHTYQKKFKKIYWSCCPWNYHWWPDYPSPLWVAVAANLLQSVEFMTSQGSRLDRTTHPLHTAAHDGYKKMVALLLDLGMDINTRGGAYENALQAAACQGHKSTVQMLLHRGADVNAQGGRYGTALQGAASEGHETIVHMLLDQGAYVNDRVRGRTALYGAAYYGHETIVQLLLDRGAEVNARGGYFDTALQAAACLGHKSTVQMLLDRGANMNAQGEQYGTALQGAAFYGEETIVQMLLDRGADVNAQGGKYGTALVTAAYEKHENIVQMLLDRGADVNAQGGEYGTALVAAAYQELENIVQMLLDRGADMNAQGGEYGTALYGAASEGHETIVQLLLDRGAEVNAQGGYFNTALQAAASEGHEIIVQLLLDRGAEVNAQGGNFDTALQAAASEGHEIVVQLLLGRGADVNAQGGFHGTALHAAAGAEVNVEAGTYGTALQAAAYKGSESIVQLLLDRGAHVNTQGGRQVWKGCENIVQLLLDQGADVNAQGGQYGTALQAPAYGGHNDIVQMLLDTGGDVNALGGKYKTALQAAREQGYPIVEQILLARGAQEYIENSSDEILDSEESLKESVDQ
ncbi:ankyrin [Favolaschia claudopus]|uniref:Ankyrin n=1 Tax=Favolaschia claudopus TaxID=2862362 RepID=A0AAW0BYV7_9AGAR